MYCKVKNSWLSRVWSRANLTAMYIIYMTIYMYCSQVYLAFACLVMANLIGARSECSAVGSKLPG